CPRTGPAALRLLLERLALAARRARQLQPAHRLAQGAERRLRAFGYAAVGAHCDGLFQAVQARVAYEQRGRMSGKIGPFVIRRAGTADEDFGCTARDVTEREELRMRVAEVNALYRVADAIARAT